MSAIMNAEPEARACSQEQSDLQEPDPQEPDLQTTSSRKRPIDSDNDDEPVAKRAQLTRENLALFDKMVKKKQGDGIPNPTQELTTTKSTTTRSTALISTTSPGFALRACDNGILDYIHSKPPMNLAEIRKRYAKSNNTAPPSEAEYRFYALKVPKAVNEMTMLVRVNGRVVTEYLDDWYDQAFNQQFTGFPQDVGFNNGLSPPQPDFIEGLELQAFRPFPVHRHISGAVLYKDNTTSITLPHIAGEWKGKGKDMEEARLQSAYDGAAMVYARNQALAYMGKSDPPGHSEITTFTTDGTNLNMFAHYAAPSEEDSSTLEYHQFEYASVNIKNSYQGHKDGRRGLRNVQDYARDQSYALKDQLKEHWKEQRRRVHQQPASDSEPDEEPGPNEDEDDMDSYEPPPAASSNPRKPPRSLAPSRKRMASNSPRSLTTSTTKTHSTHKRKVSGPTISRTT